MSYELQRAVIETGSSYGTLDEIFLLLLGMSMGFIIINFIYFDIIKTWRKLNARDDIQKMLGKDLFEEPEEECVLRDELFK